MFLHAMSGHEGTLQLPDTSFYDLLHMGAVESSSLPAAVWHYLCQGDLLAQSAVTRSSVWESSVVIYCS